MNELEGAQEKHGREANRKRGKSAPAFMGVICVCANENLPNSSMFSTEINALII